MPIEIVTFALFTVALVAIIASWRHELRNQSRERLLALMDDLDEDDRRIGTRGPLSLWLLRAGYRQPTAARRFLTLTLAAAVAGLVVALLVQFTGVSALLAEQFLEIPGNLAQVLTVASLTLPWLLLVFTALAPTLSVRARRRTRAFRIQAELPVLLDLMATLTRAGLGFDAALARYLVAAAPSSPLVDEWRQFQREIAAGQARTRALRGVASRCHVIPVSTAISALVQAEIQGSSISAILSRQADDVRQQRRNQVLLRAQALPVKLVFPLMICFLPGIFLITLGPAFLEFINLADQIIQDTAR